MQYHNHSGRKLTTSINGETVRVIGETGQIPDGLELQILYYNVITTSDTGISTNTNIKLAKTLNDAISMINAITMSMVMVVLLKIVSRVSDKNSGDLGHPIQYDWNRKLLTGWYINVATASTENSVFIRTIAGLGTTAGLG